MSAPKTFARLCVIKRADSAMQAPPSNDYTPASETEVQGLRRSSNPKFIQDLAALRIKNRFPFANHTERDICFDTGCVLGSHHLQTAHLVPHSETRIPDVVRLKTRSSACRCLKSTLIAGYISDHL